MCPLVGFVNLWRATSPPPWGSRTSEDRPVQVQKCTGARARARAIELPWRHVAFGEFQLSFSAPMGGAGADAVILGNLFAMVNKRNS